MSSASGEIHRTSRIPYFDNMKFVLISLVVLGHALALVSDRSHLASALLNFIYLFHMPVFVFISGLFAGNSYKEGKNGLNVNLVVGFFILYFLIYSAFWLIGVAADREWAYNPFYTNSLAWYMLSMAWWTLSIPFVSKFGLLRASTISVAFSLIIGFFDQFSGFLALSRTIVFAPFFFLGYFIGPARCLKFMRRIQRNFGFVISAIAIMTIFFAITFVYVEAANDFHKLAVGYNSYEEIGGVFSNAVSAFLGRLLFYAVACILGTCFIVLIPQEKTPFTFLGQRTLAVYSLHALILNIGTWVLHLDLPLAEFSSPIALIILFAISALLTIGLSWRPISKPFAIVMNARYINRKDDWGTGLNRLLP